MQPAIEFIPLRAALCTEMPTTLDVLIRLTPPAPQDIPQRPAINLSLVLDRSGSMAERNKITFTKQAAIHAVNQLLPSDRVSVVTFESHVNTPVSSQLVRSRRYILQQIQQIQVGGGTALHAGWLEGGVQVSQHLQPASLNRVILLSDGIANVGETNPDVIATDVHGLAQRGVSTTTMGVGDDYNESLLEAIAVSGDGNYYYIERPDQLPDIFAMELQGLMATQGKNVSLNFTLPPQVQLLDVFNDFATLSNGDYQLPNLVAGSPFTLALRLKIPPQTLPSILTLHLAWDDVETSQRQHINQSLSLPWVNRQSLNEFPFNPEVQQEVAALLASRAKKEAAEQARQGQYDLAEQTIAKGMEAIQSAPASPAMSQESNSLQSLNTNLKRREYEQFMKRGHFESHSRSRGWGQSRYGEYQEERQKKVPSPSPVPPSGQEAKPWQQVGNRIKVVKGDITQMAVDVIVNATNPLMTGTYGVDGAIHRAAGPELRQACNALVTCDVGEAKITPAFNLPAQYVIHTVGPGWQEGRAKEEEQLTNCYRNALKLVLEKGLKTVSFPSIATGALGCPPDWAASIALRTISAVLQQQPSIEQAIIVCWDDRNYQCYQALL
ncbi:macro domain-containing protein [Roseofilum sp. BLCC_M154]|uniref:Macro domain-containing protein n=1 Tax=Roseofilum acuticapitatum BLCC-M154 TaxID=3022444 RepID=A0ABT7AQC4_9CYAN|nr:macro domain-containing protein [Roseofilum acuticapitatum]MDJ1169089.1 macro domain-containing protein [Roseofilum acuticapitatum BLCC-M154]